MNQDMFGPDFFDDAGADGSYSTFSSSEHDHPLSLPLDIFRSNENLTASLETTFQDRSQWPYNGPDWEVGQAPPSAVTPFDDDSLPSRDGYGYAYSYTTENTAHDQTDTGAINPAENPALLYNQNDLRTDANGGLPADFANLDTSDDQPFAESLGPCDSLVQSQELRVETSSRKDSRKPTRRRASGRGSSPSVLTSTTPTNIRTRRGRRPSRGHNGEHRRLPCTWHGCTDTSKNNSELK